MLYNRFNSSRTNQNANPQTLIVKKGSEEYQFTFDDKSRVELLRVLGRYASNPDLSFDWHDAALTSRTLQSLKDFRAKTAIHIKGESERKNPPTPKFDQ